MFYLLVCDDHAFKDQMLFYRFRRDDGSRGYDKDVQLVFQAIDIYNRLKKSTIVFESVSF